MPDLNKQFVSNLTSLMMNLGDNKIYKLWKLLTSFNSQLKFLQLLCYKWTMKTCRKTCCFKVHLTLE